MWLLILVLVVLVILVALVMAAARRYCRVSDGVGDSAVVTGGAPSKSEEATREIFEDIFDAKFPTSRPEWLGGLELDGYNEKLGVGFEFQGPQHTKYSTRYDGDYIGYARRVTDDKYKVAMSADMGKCLVIVDYIVKDPRAYIISRLHDYYIRHKAQCRRRGWPEWLGKRPRKYLKKVVHKPYTKFGMV